jgi:tRNA A37 methylthiotransferase MiaB
MTALVKQIQRETNSKWVGWAGKVLIDELVKDALVGRNYAYKPCLFKRDQLPFSEESLGKEVDARIVDYTSSTLRAIVC